jgi:hypothetical protein
MGALTLDPAVVIPGGGVLGLLLDRPPDDAEQPDERNLQRQHQPHESPGHDLAILSLLDGKEKPPSTWRLRLGFYTFAV